MKRIANCLLLLLLWAVLGPAAAPAAAHGGGTPRLVNVPVGPFILSAWTQPEPPRVGQLHVTVALSEPDATVSTRPGDPALNQSVRLDVINPRNGAVELSVPVTHGSAANKLFYEADFPIDRGGDWTIVLTVNELDNVAFTLEVAAAGPSRLLILGGAALVLLLAGGLWRQRAARRAAQRVTA